MTTVKVLAPAKVNLALHVTGLRSDGFHLLESLVVFADVADVLHLSEAGDTKLMVSGPEAEGIPAGPDNLILRTLKRLAPDRSAQVHLVKNLPAAAGLGGGSADAAAVVRAAFALWPDLVRQNRSMDHLHAELATLGADIPMCLASTPCRADGIGEKIEHISLPQTPALLVNPRVSLSTPQVFQQLSDKQNGRLPVLENVSDRMSLVDFLRVQRNDLERPAVKIAPVLEDVLRHLREFEKTQLVRMSGSGATCFALFETQDAAHEAGKELAVLRPEWWVWSGMLGDQGRAAEPQIK